MDNINSQKFRKAEAVSCTALASTFHYFDFETDSPLIFQPGQYIEVQVADDRINAYSIAGHEGLLKFNLLVDVKPGGPGSKFFEHLKIGNRISFLGPFGTFTLKLDDRAEHLLFLATGCGITPLKCMIDSALKEKNCRLPITLYFGLSYSGDVFWQDVLIKLSKEYPNFNFKIAVWKPDQTWQGETGFITEFLKEDFPDASQLSAYLCGNKDMIADATQILLERGCLKKRIYTEKY